MKSLSQKISLPVQACPDAVWGVIGAVGGVDKWFSSMIESCKVEGDKRFCVTTDGIPLNEHVIHVDHEQREFKFAIPEQTFLPVTNIVEVMNVSEGSNGNSIVEWSATFDATAENGVIAQGAFEQVWTQGIKELEEYILAH